MTRRVVAAKPCNHCPFRKDVLGDGKFIRGTRAQEIAAALLMGEGFPCHETTHKKRVVLHCAGAALLLAKEGKDNQPMQIAKRLRIWNQPTDPQNVLVDSFKEFIQHHTEKR